MTAAFIIAEYNPFHKGHEYHINATKEALRPDAVVCVMSGHFTQRGSAAISDKWSRARMALHAGADLVLELHPAYACSSAEYFARGALMTVSALGAEGWLSFGAENTDMQLITNIAQILNDEPVLFKSVLTYSLSNGLSYAAARQRALLSCYPGIYGIPVGAAGNARQRLAVFLKAPNNILAVEYVKAIKFLALHLEPYAVQRGEYPGASVIRDSIRGLYDFANDRVPSKEAGSEMPSAPGASGLGALPGYSQALLSAEFSMGKGPVFDDCFFPQIVSAVRRGAPECLLGYHDVSEGLENRLYRAAQMAGSYGELIHLATTRRYPMSRVRRVFARVLLGYTKAALDGIGLPAGPPYLRALGFSANGQKYLSGLKPAVPVITSYKHLRGVGGRAQAFMELEARSTDIYAAAFQNPAFRIAGQDFTRNPVRL